MIRINITQSSRVTVRDLPSIDDIDPAIIQHMVRRAEARMHDDIAALLRGEPMRHEIKPANAFRVDKL